MVACNVVRVEMCMNDTGSIKITWRSVVVCSRCSVYVMRSEVVVDHPTELTFMITDVMLWIYF